MTVRENVKPIWRSFPHRKNEKTGRPKLKKMANGRYNERRRRKSIIAHTRIKSLGKKVNTRGKLIFESGEVTRTFSIPKVSKSVDLKLQMAEKFQNCKKTFII